MEKVKLSPSLMCVDILNIQKELSVLDAEADYYHIDIIDWHYCKNMCLSPMFIEAVHKVTDVPLDVHLYVDNVDSDLIQLCIDSGAEIIELPADVIGRQVNRFANLIHSQGKQFGIFVNPADKLDIIETYADSIDWLNIMTVDPGFGGQAFVESTLPKIAQANRWKQERGYHYTICSDGCCSKPHYRRLYDAGVEVFTLGSSGLFGLDRADTRHALDLCMKNIEEELK